MKFAALALAICLSAPLKIVALTNDVQFEVLATTIPRAISDHSASVHNPHGTIYIAGGCDDPLGNTFDANAKVYACNSISSYMYKFDAINEEIVELPQMPRRRYRHASAIVNNQLWILGGRDFFDTLIPEIDIFDIASNTWSTIGNFTDVTSDLASFSSGTSVYAIGGYDSDYNATNQLVKFSFNETSLTLIQKNAAPLGFGRGDISAATDGNFTYVSGGWTDDDIFCAPLGSLERYHIVSDRWETLPAVLNVPCAEKGLVFLKGRLLALGGEKSFDTKCIVNQTEYPSIWEQTVAVDEIEVLTGDTWSFLSDMADFRFRFAAVSLDIENKVFTFGGQVEYNASCDCFRTSDVIVVYTEANYTATAEPTATPSGAPTGAVPTGTSGASVVGVVGVMMGVFSTLLSLALD